MKRVSSGTVTSRRSIATVTAAALTWFVAPMPVLALNAYITNSGNNTVSVIDTATDTVVTTINVGANPNGVAVTPDGSRVYVTNQGGDSVSVIDTATNMVIGTIDGVGPFPFGVAVTPDGSKVYITNDGDTVSVIDTTTNMVKTITVGQAPAGVVVTPDGSKVYVANQFGNTVSVISTGSDTVLTTISDCSFDQPVGVAVAPDGSKVYVANGLRGDSSVIVIATAIDQVSSTIPLPGGRGPFGIAVTPDGSKVLAYITDQVHSNSVFVVDTTTNTVVLPAIPVGSNPFGIAVTPDGTKVYVANNSDRPGDVSVIATATNTVSTTIGVGSSPAAFGQFIQPLILTGKPGSANCHDESAAALALQLGGLAHAADTLGFASVKALQDTIKAFCAPVTN
jgi:YVTN family beta-propeller protein